MRVVRFLDVLFISCNLIVAGFLTVSFLRAEASANPSNAAAGNSANIPAPQYTEQQLTTIASKINDIRVSNGLKPLKQSASLDSVAEARAEDMAKNAYYAHKSPSGELFDVVMKNQGVSVGKYACENLNMAETSDPNAFVQSWLASDTHKSCLMDGQINSSGYAITKVLVSNGIPINQYIVVAIYNQEAR